MRWCLKKALSADTREEYFAENSFLLAVELKKVFVGKYGFFKVLYKTLKGLIKKKPNFHRAYCETMEVFI